MGDIADTTVAVYVGVGAEGPIPLSSIEVKCEREVEVAVPQ
jgi:hypothetical protein